jgi:hypothetical protein
MKSSSSQLESRGYLKAGVENTYADLSLAERQQLLMSILPVDRTLGARLLASQYGYWAIEDLIDALKSEKKLYPRIEICNSLASYGISACRYLIPLLGKIGTNQYTSIPEDNFKKGNYPLPRDIVSRILIRIGTPALPYLLPVLAEKDTMRVSEAVDSVGFICFYNYQAEVYDKLVACLQNNMESDLIKWKIFRAMSAFPESELFLSGQMLMHTGTLLCELERSLRIIGNRRIK